MTPLDFATRLGIACILGAAIGIERQRKQIRGVLKTNALVCMGAAMFVMMSAMTQGDASPTRVAAQVVSGIGFLGGGLILREGVSVRGLNTAATLWCASAVGTLVGSGFLVPAYIGAFVVVVANLLLQPLAQQLHLQVADAPKPEEQKSETRYRCRILCQKENEPLVQSLLLRGISQLTLSLDTYIITNLLGDTDSSVIEIVADFVLPDEDDEPIEQLVESLQVKSEQAGIKLQIEAQVGEGFYPSALWKSNIS
jgi:putative Mg2+ transporter-C (MgtC) family protein